MTKIIDKEQKYSVIDPAPSPEGVVVSAPPTEESEVTAPARDKRGRFVKGVSGNPAGRPEGTLNRTTEIKRAIEESLVDELSEDYLKVYRTLVELALQGDTTCIKILMDRAWPANQQGKSGAGRSGSININIAGLEAPEGLTIDGSENTEE